jgi:hypothetical protein
MINCISIIKKRKIQSARKIWCAFIFSLLLCNVYAQQDSAESLQQQFIAYSKKALQEKLYVHTDKNIYLAGEIIWFKIYDVDGFFHMPLAVSSVAYVEILDKKNKPVLQSKLALSKGDGDGSLFLPVTLNSGNYKFRAYTNWMKNSGPRYFFEKIITIINAQKFTDTVPQRDEIKYDIAFFPEGGNLVNALENKVAFKITDQYGKGIDCKGILMNNNNDTIQSFYSLKFGIGNFTFTPDSGHSYKAVIILPGGNKIIKELPPAYNNGYVMRLKHSTGGQLEVTVRKPANNPGNDNQLIYLFIHTRGSVKWVAGNRTQNDSAVFLIDNNKLGDGISQLTVFNSDKQPVCERLYFKYPENKLQLSVQTNQAEYDCRRKININISSGDMYGKPVQADISLAVYRIDSLQTVDEINIENYLLLTSDLIGNIESPGYYFKNNNTETEEAMDNLMLTHGWRRFEWKNIMQNKKPAFGFVPEYNGHIIYGKITDIKTGLPGKNINGFLSVPGTGTQFRNALTDSTGGIKFEMKNFYGSPEIIVQTNTLQDSNYRIDIATPFADQYSATPVPHFLMPEKNPRTLLYASINAQVLNLYTENKLQQFKIPVTDTSGFYAEPDKRYVLDDYTRFTTLEEIIREYVLAVNVSKREGKFHLAVTDSYSRQKFDNDPLVLLDGVPVFDINRFMTESDPLKMYKLDVITKRYFFGYQSFDGILNFVTYKGDLGGYELDPHAIAIDYEGLQLQRKFYAPVYETEQQVSGHLPDFRNLLFWSPEIKTNAAGKQEQVFYTSDIPGKYVIVAQGLDTSGMAGSQLFYFDVKSKAK